MSERAALRAIPIARVKEAGTDWLPTSGQIVIGKDILELLKQFRHGRTPPF